MLRRLVLVGVGLIGSSFALAHRRAGTVTEVLGVGRSRATLDEAQRLGIIDQVVGDSDVALAQALAGADLVLIAAPVGQTQAILASIGPHLGPETLVTDAGSTKAAVLDTARAVLGARFAQFVGAHPIAGAELTGPAAARAELFDKRRVILTPAPENSPETLERVAFAWRGTGASVSSMTAATHDAVLAAVSHLPHLLAYALVAHVAGGAGAATRLTHVGSGFRDTTRIAASSPEMWRDIMMSNRSALIAELDGYMAQLATLRGQVEAGDGAALEALFTSARDTRRGLDAPQP